MEHANPRQLFAGAARSGSARARPGTRLRGPATALLGLLVAAGCGGSGDDGPGGPDAQPDQPDGSMPGDASPPDAMLGPDAGPPDGFGFPDKLRASNGASRNWFGYSVAASDETIVVGAPFYDRLLGDEVDEASIGTAYVFERNGSSWLQTAQIFSSDGDSSSMFGWSVAVDGDLIAVGAWKQDIPGTQSGAVYVFERSGGTWGQVARLDPPSGDGQEAFGYAVSVSNGRVAVGAPVTTDIDDDEPATPAYVFERSGVTWTGAPILPADDPRDAWFGTSIALDGTTLVVGAPGDKRRGPGSGAAYVFEYDGTNWNQARRLEDTGGQSEDFFGRSVAVHGDVIVVGVEGGGDPSTLNTGMAVVYERSEGTWAETSRLIPADSAVGQHLGYSVAVRGGTLVIGAHRDDDFGMDAGAAYVYEQDAGGGWVEFSKIYTPDGSSGDHFGSAVAVTDSFIVTGSRFDDTDGVESGSIYVFEKSL